MSKMLAAMHAAKQTYGTAARKRDTAASSIYKGLDKIGRHMEKQSPTKEAEDQAGDDFDLKELSEKAEQSREEYSDFIKSRNMKLQTAFPSVYANLSGTQKIN